MNTISHVETIVRAYLIPCFGNEIAEDIKPLDIQRWLKSLHDSNSLAWTTISKMRGVMRRIYKSTSRKIRYCTSRRARRLTTRPSSSRLPKRLQS